VFSASTGVVYLRVQRLNTSVCGPNLRQFTIHRASILVRSCVVYGLGVFHTYSFIIYYSLFKRSMASQPIPPAKSPKWTVDTIRSLVEKTFYSELASRSVSSKLHNDGAFAAISFTITSI
jgi:hypothetical protein